MLAKTHNRLRLSLKLGDMQLWTRDQTVTTLSYIRRYYLERCAVPGTDLHNNMLHYAIGSIFPYVPGTELDYYAIESL